MNVRVEPDRDVSLQGHYAGIVTRLAAFGIDVLVATTLYTLGGSFLWETYGEATRPSANDHLATGIGGTFAGEALFRMASLLLEHGGETPGFWRELGAAVLSPPTGFNRLVFGERFRPVFPSRDPAIFVRLRVGATLTTTVTNGRPRAPPAAEGSADYYMA